MNKYDYDYVIIDPASTEFNRGSFCYLPYIFYSALKSEDNKVHLLENFTVARLDKVPKARKYLVACWSYPQVDICETLNKFLPSQPEFFGYSPMIEWLKLPLTELSDEWIRKGIKHYPWYYPYFNYLLLSDCDMHLSKYKGEVYPLCTSYGCPNNCAFCPATVNQKQRVVLNMDDVNYQLDACENQNVVNIHFTDEDFFFDIDRAYTILKEMARRGCFHSIALGNLVGVERFIEKYEREIFKEAGLVLIEVGFETADDSLSKAMNKPLPSVERYKNLAWRVGPYVDIFWLTMSFFPGETIKTLNKTGAFLREFGHKKEDLYSRLLTNSTEGGLGQFFQPYHGTKGFDHIATKGKVVSDRPVRLLPSFIPYSFLDSTITQVREVTEEDRFWFDLYKVGAKTVTPGLTIEQNIEENKDVQSFTDSAVFFAICARLGVIK